MSTTNEDPWADFKLWYYDPSAAAGGVFCAIFGILTIFHIWRIVRHRTWFCVPFIVGGVFETVGYGARAVAANNTEALGPYITQSLLILVAPSLFAASIYMVLGRVIRATDATSFSLIRVNWLTKIFVTGDILCFLIQSAGAGLLSRADTFESLDTAENIVLGGLILQIVIFVFFVIVGALFHIRLQRRPTITSLGENMPWQRFMTMMYVVSVFVTLRNIVRVAEYAMGNRGYLLTHEWPIYVFDALLMALVLGLCLTWYDERIKPRPSGGKHASEGSMHQLENRPVDSEV